MKLNIKAGHGNKIFKRIVICAVILIISGIGMLVLINLKKPPMEIKFKERPIQVEAVSAEFEDVPAFITGFGEAAVLDTVSIAPEISGKIVAIHPRLESGEVIPEGGILFQIDSRDYAAAEKEARSTVNRWKNTILRLEKENSINRDRLKTLNRNKELANEEFERIKSLFEKDNVGTRSGVDTAERSFNSAVDLADQMRQAVALYPVRIKEAKNSLIAAMARHEIRGINLTRCTVYSPFTARIKKVTLEKGQYVSPGFEVITLANDAVLEIHVALDSRDARKWMLFNEEELNKETAWFNSLTPLICQIHWTENMSGSVWQGKLNRVVKFDRQTRMLTVAVRLDAKDAALINSKGLPLVEGMFCSVKIPGKIMYNVIRLPRWAVSFENTVYTAVKNRLKTMPVTVARVEGDQAFVSGGLAAGDIVIITRLIDPLEHSLLKITGLNSSTGKNKGTGS